jgi:pentatricopeptide repeat protein
METDSRAKKLGIRPDTVTFNTLLKCLLKGDKKIAGTEAEKIIDQMEKRFDAGEMQLKPNEITFILAAKAYLLQRDVDKAEAILERMEKSGIYADCRNYNVILLQISKMELANTGERVEKILARMSAIGKEKFPSTKPDVFSYSIAMDAWIHSGLEDAASRVFALYVEMTNEGVEPNDVIFNTLITFLSKQKDMDKILKAEQLLYVMRDSKTLSVKPDFRHFAPVINGWLNVNSALGAQGAERVLLRWIEQYMNSANNAGKIDPSQFDKVAKAWIRAGDPLRATKLIYHVKMLHDNKLIPDGPNPMTYGKTLVRAWKKTNHPETERQLQVLEATLAEMQGSDS